MISEHELRKWSTSEWHFTARTERPYGIVMPHSTIDHISKHYHMQRQFFIRKVDKIFTYLLAGCCFPSHLSRSSTLFADRQAALSLQESLGIELPQSRQNRYTRQHSHFSNNLMWLFNKRKLHLVHNLFVMVLATSPL